MVRFVFVLDMLLCTAVTRVRSPASVPTVPVQLYWYGTVLVPVPVPVDHHQQQHGEALRAFSQNLTGRLLVATPDRLYPVLHTSRDAALARAGLTRASAFGKWGNLTVAI